MSIRKNMKFVAYCKMNDDEFSIEYISDYRNSSKENKEDLLLKLKEYCKDNHFNINEIDVLHTVNITPRERSEKTKNSNESKMRWEDKAYRKYTVNLNKKTHIIRLRKDNDEKIIEYIEAKRKEGIGITQIVRCAMNLLIECEEHSEE